MQSVKADGGVLAAQDEFGAEWKQAAGAPKKKQTQSRFVSGTSVPSVQLRLDGEFRASMIATWALNSSAPGAELEV